MTTFHFPLSLQESHEVAFRIRRIPLCIRGEQREAYRYCDLPSYHSASEWQNLIELDSEPRMCFYLPRQNAYIEKGKVDIKSSKHFHEVETNVYYNRLEET